MDAVTSSSVAAYAGLVDSLAHKLSGYSDAEYDDLYQEGNLSVLLALRAGKHVSRGVVLCRMLNWCRYLRKLDNLDAIAYEKLLPMEHHAIDEL